MHCILFFLYFGENCASLSITNESILIIPPEMMHSQSISVTVHVSYGFGESAEASSLIVIYNQDFRPLVYINSNINQVNSNDKLVIDAFVTTVSLCLGCPTTLLILV
jgi:hypothetical protein